MFQLKHFTNMTIYVLETPYALTGTHNLAKATAKGNTIVLFVVSANDKQVKFLPGFEGPLPFVLEIERGAEKEKKLIMELLHKELEEEITRIQEMMQPSASIKYREIDDESTVDIVYHVYNLTKLHMYIINQRLAVMEAGSL
ncbi:hypothetical protein V8G54_027722 [Vigna mungo]|uniref:Uncharacterized protein n=1 Tax=Vigna mungo TaxID=3915 RepID=A0AAQ3MRA3_VIGMU